VLVGVFAFSVFNSGKGRELRRLIQFDRIVDGSATNVRLTDAEWERAVDLLGDIARAAVPWIVVLFVVLIVASTWATALAARVADRVGSGTVEDVSRPDDSADAIRRVPAVAGALLAFSLIGLGVMALTLLPLFVAVAADAGGGAIAVTGIFGFAAALVSGSLVFVRLSLAMVLASLGGWGLGLRRSWQLTEGHFWGVVGRLLVAVSIASAASFPLSVVNSIGFSLGFTTWMVSLLVVQTIGNVVTTVVTVPAQVVLVRHLTERQGRGRLAS
jgi:FtsH-binding integral membrane protein